MRIQKGYIPLLFVVLMLIVSLTWVSRGNAAPSIELFINGRHIATDTPPIIINNRTMVPIRFVAEEFGAKVNYDGVHNRVVISQTTPQSYNLVKFNGSATTWPYWEEDGHVYLEYRNCIELLRTQYKSPWHLIGFNEINKNMVIDNKSIGTLNKEIDGFIVISLNDLQRQNIIHFEWDEANSNITLK